MEEFQEADDMSLGLDVSFHFSGFMSHFMAQVKVVHIFQNGKSHDYDKYANQSTSSRLGG
jgi:hypothetical protein